MAQAFVVPEFKKKKERRNVKYMGSASMVRVSRTTFPEPVRETRKAADE